MKAIKFVDEFPHSYVLDVAPDLPERTERAISFSPVHPLAIRSSVFHNIRFYPEKSDSWIAQFEASGRSGFEDTVLSVPIPDQTCVVSCGTGYWVNVEAKTAKILDLSLPITSAGASRKHALILVSTWRDIVAYRSAEPAWSLPRIADDRLHISRIENDTATATGFVNGDHAELKIDLVNGKLLQFQ